MEFTLFVVSFAYILYTVQGFPTPPTLVPRTQTPRSQGVADHSHSVAFSVGLSHTQHVSLQDTIIYDKVFVNNGNGYDKNSGIFICPVAGLYIFHFHAYDTNTDRAMWLELLHNNQVTVSVSGYNSHTSGGNTVMLKLNKYDRIEVKARDKQSFSLFGLSDQIYSTLTGYLLSPTNIVFYDPNIVGK